MLRFISIFATGGAGSPALQPRPIIRTDQIVKIPSILPHPSIPSVGGFSSSIFSRGLSVNQRRFFNTTLDKQYGYYHVLMKWPVSKGNTLLHESIKNCYLGDGKIDDTVVDKLIEKIGKDDVRLMSVMVNDDGKLPVNMLPGIYNSKRSALCNQLEEMIQTNPIGMKNIHDLIDIDEVNQRINPHQNSNLSQNITILVDAINQTRRDIRYSNTHLLFNDLNEVSKHEIAVAISMMRDTYIKNRSDVMTADVVFCVSKAAKKYSHGNCHEYSCVLAEYIMTKLPNLPVEIISIKRGDHVFVVVGRDQESDIMKPETWGRDAIVCDAWIGDIYMASELNKRLTTFSLMFISREFKRVLRSFNPNFHYLYVNFSSQQDKPACVLSGKM